MQKIVKQINNISLIGKDIKKRKKFLRFKPFSGPEALDVLIDIAEKMDSDFSIDYLKSSGFMSSHNHALGDPSFNFTEFTRQCAGFGDKEMDSYKYGEIFGSTKQLYNNENWFTHDSINRIKNRFSFFDSKVLDKTKQQDLLGIEYYFSWSWNYNEQYYDKEYAMNNIFLNEMPKTLANIIRAKNLFYFKITGMKEVAEENKKFYKVIEDKKINNENTFFLNKSNHESDIFEYRNRILVMQKDGARRSHEPVSFHSPSILWAHGVYAKSGDPIAFSIIKTNEKCTLPISYSKLIRG
jgi:hypothetical protein